MVLEPGCISWGVPGQYQMVACTSTTPGVGGPLAKPCSCPGLRRSTSPEPMVFHPAAAWISQLIRCGAPGMPLRSAARSSAPSAVPTPTAPGTSGSRRASSARSSSMVRSRSGEVAVFSRSEMALRTCATRGCLRSGTEPGMALAQLARAPRAAASGRCSHGSGVRARRHHPRSRVARSRVARADPTTGARGNPSRPRAVSAVPPSSWAMSAVDLQWRGAPRCPSRWTVALRRRVARCTPLAGAPTWTGSRR